MESTFCELFKITFNEMKKNFWNEQNLITRSERERSGKNIFHEWKEFAYCLNAESLLLLKRQTGFLKIHNLVKFIGIIHFKTIVAKVKTTLRLYALHTIELQIIP